MGPYVSLGTSPGAPATRQAEPQARPVGLSCRQTVMLLLHLAQTARRGSPLAETHVYSHR